MDLIDRIKALAVNLDDRLEHLKTEEATKHSLVMPFIQALGYNVFDPTEVVPEFTADHGLKKGEKVDYAIMKEGSPVMLIEAKWAGVELDKSHLSQLFRYFTVTHARVGILTNGIKYRFYMDLDEPNKMDKTPFLEIDLRNIKESLIPELKKLTKDQFNVDEVQSSAHDLKYLTATKNLIAAWFQAPDDDLVKLICGQVYPGRTTEKIRLQFGDIIKRAFTQYLNEQMSGRLQLAIDPKAPSPAAAESDDEVVPVDLDDKASRIETTEEEIEGYHIVKSICREVSSPERIVHRDTVSYMGILFDDNNRKPICRLHFNTANKRIGLFDENKVETKHPIDTLDDIYQFSAQLQATVGFYLPQDAAVEA